MKKLIFETLRVVIIPLIICSSLPAESYDMSGSSLISTFYGGTGEEFGFGHSIAVDAEGNIYVAGRTTSSDLTILPGAYDDSYGGGYDIYVAKFDANLNTLLASTYLGGSDFEGQAQIALDQDGNVLIISSTYSSDFPTTPGAYDRLLNGGCDFFVTKLSSDLSQLLASTLIGGDGCEGEGKIAVDSDGNIFIGGLTSYQNYPTTPGAYDRIYHEGGSDYVVSKLDNSLTQLLASTFIGGSNLEEYPGLGLDGEGNVYIGGSSSSDDFPVTPGAFDDTYNGFDNGTYYRDAAIAKLSNDLTTLLAGTYVGRANIFTIGVSANGDVCLTGHTGNESYPVTPGAFVTTHNGDDESVLSVLSDNLANLKGSSFLSGIPGDNHGLGNTLAFDADGNVYMAGYSFSEYFHTTPDAWDTTHNGGADGILMKFDGTLSNLEYSTYLGGAAGDLVNQLLVNENGEVYLVGKTSSTDFPIPDPANAYDSLYKGSGDTFIARLNLNVLCGDANGDGGRNIGDVVYLVNFIFNNGPAPAPIETGNVNCDEAVNVGDAVYLGNYIFRPGSPAPCAACK